MEPGVHPPRPRAAEEGSGAGEKWFLTPFPVSFSGPTLQRFISEDPIGFAGKQVSLYAYALNSPVMYGDRTGEGPVLLGTAIAVASLRVGYVVSNADEILSDAKALEAYANEHISKETYPERKDEIDKVKHEWVEKQLTIKWGPDVALAGGIYKEWKDLTDKNEGLYSELCNWL